MTQVEWAATLSAFVAFCGVFVTLLLSTAKLGRMAGVMETSITTQNAMIVELKSEISKLSEVIVLAAVQTNRLNTLTEQFLRLEKRVDELSHGIGFMIPPPGTIRPSG